MEINKCEKKQRRRRRERERERGGCVLGKQARTNGTCTSILHLLGLLNFFKNVVFFNFCKIL